MRVQSTISRAFVPWPIAAVLVALLAMGCQNGPDQTPSPGAAPAASVTLATVTAIPPLQSPLLEPSPTADAAPIVDTTLVGANDQPEATAGTPVTRTVAAVATADSSATEPVYGYRVVNVYPHDPSAFTEGLVYMDGDLYEGTGLDNESNPPGQSVLQKKDLETGQVLQSVVLAPEYFGEGVAVLGDKIYQLTWQERTGFVYDKDTLQLLDTFSISTDGWGLTTDGEHLIRSDGSNTLRFLDPETLEEVATVDVLTHQGSPVTNLNELEYIDGEIYANVWLTDTIVRIDPGTGRVLGVIDLSGLLPPEDRLQRVDVLNGIAYDAAADRLFVTGKWWPKLFEIDLVAAGS